MIDDHHLQRLANGIADDVIPAIARELLAARQQIIRLKAQLAAPVKLPYTSASPVCDIEAGYAAGVTDCKEAIRRAGFLIEGDD